MENILKEVYLDDGGRVVILDRLGMENIYGKEECARNLYRLSKSEEPIWQVTSDFDSEGNPFTNITLNNDSSLVAYRWDGGAYTIDIESGFASPFLFLK